jgi:hypothetical protein
MTDDLVEPFKALVARKRGALTKRKSGGSLLAKHARDGVALIRQHLSDDVVEHFHRAAVCGDQISRGDIDWLGRIGMGAAHDYIERAKASYYAKLPDAGRVYSAADFLGDLRGHPWDDPVDRDEASAMLHFLFSLAPGKRDDDERMLKLVACTEMFSPSNNLLGEATGLWKPVPQQPILLALAIKHLQATQTFEPSEPELRAAIATASRNAKRLEHNANEWLKRLRESDALMFKNDRPAWEAVYATVRSDVVLAMYEDDEPPRGHADAPHWNALNAIWEAKYEAEEQAAALEREAEDKAAALIEHDEQTNNTGALAACKQSSAKRTHKPKGGGNA